MIAQERTSSATGAVGTVPVQHEGFRSAFKRLLLGGADRDLHAGWQLALDVGRPAVPLLWDMMKEEKSNVGRRLAVLAAAVLAGGPGEDDLLFHWLDSQVTMHEERVMVGLLLAMGPRRSRPMPEFWSRCFGPAKSIQPILGVAARLASTRFPGTEIGAPSLTSEDDPGLLAATAFAGLPISPSVAARLWNPRTAPDKHADLFWRGALLGGLQRRDAQLPDGLLAHARETMELQSDQYLPARAAAALLLARAKAVRPDGPRPPWRLLQLLASEPEAAVLLKPWLPAQPPGLNDEEPQRLAVCYALSRDAATVVAERQQWMVDARVARHVALALAFRLLGEEHPLAIDAQIPSLPEWFFVRWAAAGRTIAREDTISDPVLESLAVLAVDGRLPRSVARTAIEDVLWRWGSHPGIGLFENERLLVRDLMLLGSRQGGKYLPSRPSHQLYQPAGLDKEHVFFDVAVPLWDFLSQPRLPMPAEYRLR